MKTLNDNPSSGNPLPTDKEFYEKDFNTTLEAEMFDNGPETEGERLGDHAMKGAAWLAGIVGLFALAIVIAAAFDLSPTPSPSKPHNAKYAAQQAYLSSPSGSNIAAYDGKYANIFAKYNSQPVVLKSITVIAKEPAKVMTNVANGTPTAVKTVAKEAAAPAKAVAAQANAKAADVQATANATAAPAMSKADMDRIEKEALEVIHGDYGNNPGRAQKLGADYDLVQARVNQLLHS